MVRLTAVSLRWWVSVKVEILINKSTDIPYLYLKNSIFAVTNIIYKGAGNPASEKLRAFICL